MYVSINYVLILWKTKLIRVDDVLRININNWITFLYSFKAPNDIFDDRIFKILLN